MRRKSLRLVLNTIVIESKVVHKIPRRFYDKKYDTVNGSGESSDDHKVQLQHVTVTIVPIIQCPEKNWTNFMCIYIDTFKVSNYVLGYYNLSIFIDNVNDICKIKN